MGNEQKTPILVYNRYTQALETEAVYGERWLRWAYDTTMGRATTNILLKRAFFSKLYGWLMKRPSSRNKVLPFIKDFAVDMAAFEKKAEAFTSFNDFFVRTLKPGARSIVADPKAISFPADGRHLGFQDISQIKGVFIKGQQWNLPQFLGDQHLAERYQKGSLVLSRLCPTDYHRFHFPVTGIPSASHLIKGSLKSVNPIALRQNLTILCENKRFLTSIQTDSLGTVLMLEIGATCVGSITQTFFPETLATKGSEKGFFSFGGSATCLLFEPGCAQLDADLLEQTRQGNELYAHMGDQMGRINN